MKPIAAGLLAVLALGAGPACGEPNDTILRYNGRPQENVAVTADTTEGVEFAVTGEDGTVKSRIAAAQVKTVIYGDEPVSFSLAREFLARGNYQLALGRFKDAANAKARPWIKVYVPFGIAECERRLGQFEPAVAHYQEVITAEATSRLAPPSLDGMAQCFIQLGGQSLAKAWETYGKLESGNYGESWKLRARFGKGRVRMFEGAAAQKEGNADAAKGRFQEALQQFNDLIQSISAKEELGEEQQDLLVRAKAQKGEALRVMGEQEKAVQWFTQFIADTQGTKKGAAEAYSGRGDCFFFVAQGPEDYRRALWDYLRVTVTYPFATEAHQNALARSAECLAKLGERGRATEYVNLVKVFYPDKEVKIAVVEEKKPETTGGETKPAPALRQLKVVTDVAKVYRDKNVVYQAKKGEQFAIVDQQGKWYGIKVTVGGQETTGWIAQQDVEIAGEGPKPEEKKPEPPKAEDKGTVTVKSETADYYRDRKAAGKVKKGDSFPVVQTSEGWYGVRMVLEGKELAVWIPAKDVDFIAPGQAKPEEKPVPKPAAGPKGLVTISAETTNVLRERKVVTQVKKGESYPVVETAEGWYGIRLKIGNEDSVGWVSAKDVQYTPPSP